MLASDASTESPASDPSSPSVAADARRSGSPSGPLRALVVGAGIAGDATALQLERAGWRVVVAEIAPTLRSGGQTVDLRGGSAATLSRLGLLAACEAKLVEQRGLRWVDGDGRAIAEMPVTAFGGAGFVSTRELLRADLAAVLHGACGSGVEHRFGETVEALEADVDGVLVSFRRAAAEHFDLVVGADGAHSKVRSLTFGPESQFRRELGLAHAWATVAEPEGRAPLDGWYLVHNAPGARVVEARPGHPGQMEVGFSFSIDAPLDRHLDREAQLALLEEHFAGVGWRSAELLAAVRTADDFALDTFDQIHADAWSRGRVVLVGDAAWCSSPLSGLGTALALRGSEQLVEALGRPGSVEERLAAYEQAMRPRTDSARRLPPGRVRSYAPRTQRGIEAVARLMTFLQRRRIAKVLTRIASRDAAHGDG